MSDRGWRLLRGCLLGVGLWQFAFHGYYSFSGPTPPPFWQLYVVPWLSHLAVSAPFIVAGIITGCVRNPRRPERLAALISSLAALAVVPPQAPSELRDALHELSLFVFGCSPGGYHFSLSGWLPYEPLQLFGILFFMGEAAVAGWVGAHATRGTWEEFRRGKGGAILKGGLAAGAVELAWRLLSWYGPVGVAERAQLAALGATHPVAPLQIIVLGSPTAIPAGALITALLVRWRPRPLLGAFAGSGIALFIQGGASLMQQILQQMQWEASLGAQLSPHFHRPQMLAATWVMVFLGAALRGAVAGVFAGRWERGEKS